jgi:hypothetical protein
MGIASLRRAVAMGVALLVTVLTLGRVPVDRSGASTGSGAGDGPGGARVTRMRG